MQPVTNLRRLLTYWRRRKFIADLSHVGPAELAILVQMARLGKRWPRRWWWLNEWQEVRVIE